MNKINKLKSIYRLLTIPLYRRLNNDLSLNDYVIDLGCGADSCIKYLLFRPKKVIGVEVFFNSFKEALKSRFYDGVIGGNILDGFIMDRYSELNFNCVVLIDVLEHLSFSEGIVLLDFLESKFSKIIIFTPEGFFVNPVEDNPFQEHLSGWSIDDFKSRAYDVAVINNFSINSLYAIKRIKNV